MRLGGGAFREVNLAPLGDKILGGHGSVANSESFIPSGMAGVCAGKLSASIPGATGVVKYDSQLHCQNQRRDNHGFPGKLKQLNVDIKTSKQLNCGNMLKNKVAGLSRTHNQSEKQWLHRDEPPIKTMKTNGNLIPICRLGGGGLPHSTSQCGEIRLAAGFGQRHKPVKANPSAENSETKPY
jgi:hypothetical protein